MFDLLLRADPQTVPIPLPGRAIVFAGSDGALKARLSDGSFHQGAGAGAGGGGGGGGAPAAVPDICVLHQLAAQNLPSNVATVVAFDNVEVDTGSAYSMADKRFKPTKPGWYLIDATLSFNASPTFVALAIYKNGVALRYGTQASASLYTAMVNAMVFMNGVDDYLEVQVTVYTGVQCGGNGATTYFDALWLRGA